MSIMHSQKHTSVCSADPMPGTVLSTLQALASLTPAITPSGKHWDPPYLQIRHLKLREVKESMETQLRAEKWRFKLGLPAPDSQAQPGHPSTSPGNSIVEPLPGPLRGTYHYEARL